MERHLDKHWASDIWDENRFIRLSRVAGWMKKRVTNMVVCCILMGGLIMTDLIDSGLVFICDWYDRSWIEGTSSVKEIGHV
jgi:hypothetical protein